jgi:hypothetical protein
MEILTLKGKHQTHEIHIEGNKVVKWFNVLDNEKVLFTWFKREKEFKVYADKKGEYIKLNVDGKNYKHYIQ